MSELAVAARTRLGLVTSDPGYPDRASSLTASLVRSVLAQARFTDVTVLLTERPRPSGLSAEWRRAGATVRVAPPDPGAVDADWGYFSHVLITGGAALSRAVAWAESTQPQAARIVFLPELPWRRPEGLMGLAGSEDRPGLVYEIDELRNRDTDLIRWADVVWCGSVADAQAVAALVPGRTVAVIPPAVDATSEQAGWAERTGVSLTALGGFDAQSGADEGALLALSEVLPQLCRGGRSVPATLIADGTSAGLRAAATAAGVAVTGRAHLDEVVGASRVLLCPSVFGTGQPDAIEAALRTGTPCVALPIAGGDPEMGTGPVSGRAGDVASFAQQARRLLDSAQAWSQAAADVRRAAEQLSPVARADAVGRALAAVGITPGRPVRRPVTLVVPPVSRWRPRAKADDGLRPPVAGSVRSEGTPPSDVALSRDERYRLWAERHLPSPEMARALSDDVARHGNGPLFSVVMPVYNTPPALLRAAVESVRAQIYLRWELCIGNDGSDDDDTLGVLDDLRSDARIKVVDRRQQGGISAATNSALSVAVGDYVAFLDHDDVLKPHALVQMARWIGADPDLDVVYSDEDILDAEGRLKDVHLKPDWSPDQMLAQNYVCHLTVARRQLVQEVGALRSEFDGSQDYDLLLRLSERTDRIGHVPEPLYSWRAAPGSFAADLDSKPYAVVAGHRALEDAVARRGWAATVETVSDVGRYRVRYALPGRPHVAVIIPTRDRVDLLRRCIGSLTERTSYGNYRIVIVDNQTSDAETLGYLASGPWQVIRYPHAFNYARMTNLAAGLVQADALLFLNNDTEVINPDWMEALLEQAMRPEVGAVGARLFFGDGRPQHEGIMVGTWGDWANNVDYRGYFARGEMVRNSSAVTGACCMIRPSVFHRVGGTDPRLRVAYNDVDLCLRLRRAGYEIVYTPWAQLYHHEGSSRGDYQHGDDSVVFRDRWDPRHVLDPYYSPVFSDAVPFEVPI